MAKAFGVALYMKIGVPLDEQEPIEITHDELLALKAFDLVWFFANPAPGYFRAAMDKEKEVQRFLKQYRAGGTR